MIGVLAARESASLMDTELACERRSPDEGRLGAWMLAAGIDNGGYLNGGIWMGGNEGGLNCDGVNWPMKGKGGGGRGIPVTGPPNPGRLDVILILVKSL